MVVETLNRDKFKQIFRFRYLEHHNNDVYTYTIYNGWELVIIIGEVTTQVYIMHADPVFFPSRRTGTQNSSPADIRCFSQKCSK